MALKRVEAVLFWPYNLSVAKAVYGRPSDDSSYSKNYLQVPAAPRGILDKVFDHTNKENRVAFIWRWPGDELEATYKHKAAEGDSRGEIYIRREAKGVRPFQLGDPAADESVTFQGIGGLDKGAEATATIQQFLDKEKGWIVAVKLAGEKAVLHARAYLDIPGSSSNRSLDALPVVVRDKIRSSTEAGGIYFGQRGMRRDPLSDRVEAVLASEPNVLLTGPPGTGKTVTLEALATNFLAGVGLNFDPELWDDNWEEVAERKVVSLVFHPSYTYERFVGGLMPNADGTGFSLTARPGPLLQLAHWIGSSDREALLIIDEFNRGATAAIFGDTLALLDGPKRSTKDYEGASILRPYAGHPMKVGPAFADVESNEEVADELRLPIGLKIVAAMNSSDRSVAPLDAALRRRFNVISVPPDYSALAGRFQIPPPNSAAPFAASGTDLDSWTIADVSELAVRLLMVLNDRIASVLGSDFLLGPALLWEIEGDDVAARALSLFDYVQGRIISSLRMTFADQDELLAAILKVDSSASLPNIATLKQPEQGLSAFASPRLEWRAAADLDWKDRVRAMLHIVGS